MHTQRPRAGARAAHPRRRPGGLRGLRACHPALLPGAHREGVAQRGARPVARCCCPIRVRRGRGRGGQGHRWGRRGRGELDLFPTSFPSSSLSFSSFFSRSFGPRPLCPLSSAPALLNDQASPPPHSISLLPSSRSERMILFKGLDGRRGLRAACRGGGPPPLRTHLHAARPRGQGRGEGGPRRGGESGGGRWKGTDWPSEGGAAGAEGQVWGEMRP